MESVNVLEKIQLLRQIHDVIEIIFFTSDSFKNIKSAKRKELNNCWIFRCSVHTFCQFLAHCDPVSLILQVSHLNVMKREFGPETPLDSDVLHRWITENLVFRYTYLALLLGRLAQRKKYDQPIRPMGNVLGMFLWLKIAQNEILQLALLKRAGPVVHRQINSPN